MAQKEGQIFGSKHGYQIPGVGVSATPEIQISKAGTAAGGADAKTAAEQGKKDSA